MMKQINWLSEHKLIKLRLIIAIACIAMVCLFMPSYKAYATGPSADGRWLTTTSTADAPEKEEKDIEPQEDVSSVEKMIADVIYSVASMVSEGFSGLAGVDASTTGIVMGTVTNDDNNSIFTFSLHDDNIYGRIGATLFVMFRDIAMMFVFLMTLWAIVKGLFSSKPGQGLTDLKNTLYQAIFFLAFLYFCPYLVDYICVARDYFITVAYTAVKTFLSGTGAGLGSVTNLEEPFKENFESFHSFINAGIYAIIVFIPISFIISYVQIAIQQTILFGTFPAFCVAGMSNKKILSGWLSVVVSNAFVPVLDTLLISFVVMIKTSLDELLGSWGGTLLSAVIISVMLHSVVPARNKILGMLSGGIGVPMGGAGGMSLLSSLGTAAAGAAASALKGGGKGKNSDSDAPKGGDSDIKSEADKGLETAKMKDTEQTKGSDDNNSNALSDGASESAGGDQGVGASNDGAGSETPETASGGEGDVSIGATSGDNIEGSNITVNGGEGGADEGAVEGGNSGDDVELKPDDLNNINDINEQASMRADSMYGKEGGMLTDSDNREAYMNEVNERATNLAEMDSINRENKALDANNRQSEKDILTSQQKMAANQREIEKNEEGLKTAKGDAEKEKEYKDNISRLKAENETHQKTIDDSRMNILNNNGKKAENNDKLDEKRDVEAKFAQKQADRGFDGKAFGSAAEFKSALTRQNNIAASANYKNFKSGKMDGVLSDKEVKKYSAQAKRREMLKAAPGTAMRVAAGAALGAAGATAAYIATAGLDESQASGAIRNAAALGYNAGNKATGAIGHGIAKAGKKGMNAAGTARNNAKRNKQSGGAPGGGGGVISSSESKKVASGSSSKVVSSPQLKTSSGVNKTPVVNKAPDPSKSSGTNKGAHTRIENRRNEAGQHKGTNNGSNTAPSAPNTNKGAHTRINNKKSSQEAGANFDPKQRDYVEQYTETHSQKAQDNARKALKV